MAPELDLLSIAVSLAKFSSLRRRWPPHRRRWMRKFWADRKATLPLHFAVYLAEVGCKCAAAATMSNRYSRALASSRRRQRAPVHSCSNASSSSTTIESSMFYANLCTTKRSSNVTSRSSMALRRRLPHASCAHHTQPVKPVADASRRPNPHTAFTKQSRTT